MRFPVLATVTVLTCTLVSAAAAPDGNPIIRGVEHIPHTLPWYNPEGDFVTNASPGPIGEGISLLLSKHLYPFDDGYLDAVVRLDVPPGGAAPGKLEVRLLDAEGNELGHGFIEPLPGGRIFFSVALPESLAGHTGRIEVAWAGNGSGPVRTGRGFEVGLPKPVARQGRIRLRVPGSGAVQNGVPFTAGIPFPRGALESADHVRLVDGRGAEIPVQAEVTARWSRYGSVKWLLAHFTADIAGEEELFYLEYGPDVSSAPAAMSLEVARQEAGFPRVRTGAFELRDTGLYAQPPGGNGFRRLLDASALRGGYVEHEDGRVYRMPADAAIDIEVEGPAFAVLRAEGYYREPGSGAAFCRYDTRYFLYRDSPMLRILHTWIFTGDSGRDRIADMGWRFSLADGMEPEGFLRSFDDTRWTRAEYLLQHDYNRYDVARGGDGLERDVKGRLPGVMAASGEGLRLTVGLRDFWQNFPSELSAGGGALVFHNWPRNSRARRHSPATPDDAYRLWFAHEGEMMDLGLPPEFAEDPIWSLTHGGNPRGHRDWDEGRPQTVNAQGVARTEEIWIHIGPAGDGPEAVATVIKGLNEENLRVTVDPEWITASGVFHEIRHRDTERFPAHERVYEEMALAPGRWIERVGLYGMWVHGDNMWAPYMHRRSARLYRHLRKSHHGWPYSWIPYARSGDPRLLRLALAGTRQMTDANTCHYATPEVEAITGHAYFRRRGVWYRSPVPWAGRRRGPVTRSYQAKADYLLHAYYMTGDLRVRDVLRMLWLEEMKVEEELALRGHVSTDRVCQSLLKAAIEVYEAFHDPWALAFAHALAEGEQARHGNPDRNYRGHTWDSAEAAFLRFTGCPRFREAVALPYARRFGSQNYGRWGGQGLFDPNALGWRLTGEEDFLRRLAHEADWARQSVYEGEPDHYRGFHTREAGWTSAPLYVSWYLQHLPLALAAFAEAGREPVPLPSRFLQFPESVTRDGADHLARMPALLVWKEEGRPLPLDLDVSAGRRREGTGRYVVRGPGSTPPLEGEWDLGGARPDVVVPADAPAGVYEVRVEARLASVTNDYRHLVGLHVPVSPPGTPEVIRPEEPALGRAVWEAQYWFRVPDDAGEIEAEILVAPPHYQVRRMSVWDADGVRAWDHNMTTHDLDGALSLPVRIPVAESQRGRLWRLTLPGRSAGFRIQGGVPAIFAVSADRWFDPEER